MAQRQGSIVFSYDISSTGGTSAITVGVTQICPVFYNFSVSPTTINVNNSAATEYITVTTNSPDWSVASSYGWITVNGITGTTVEIGIAENTGTDRQGSLVFTYESDNMGDTGTAVVSVTQANVYVMRYKSTSGNIVTPTTTSGWGATIMSNTYSGGEGNITFSNEPTAIPANAFSGKTDLDRIYLPTSITSIGSSAFTGNKYINIFYDGTYGQWQNITLGTNYMMDSGTIHYKANNKVDAQYVYYSPLGTTTVKLNFGIKLTTNTKIHFISQAAGYTAAGLLLGCDYTTSDNDDFRFFQAAATTSYFDWGSSRLNGNIGLSTTSGNVWNVRLENYKVTNVTTGQYKSGSTRSSVPASNTMLGVRLGYWKVKSVEIYQGSTLVFNMSACTCDGVAGFYDSVSDTFLTVPGLVADM